MIARVLFVGLAVAAFVADRLAKLLVDAKLLVGESRQVVDGVFELRYVRNHGIAFGLFSDLGPIIVGATLIVGALLFTFMLRVEPEDLLTVVGGGLITGGALGNLVDRVQHSYVIDFLHVEHWPTFNLADVWITVGVILVILAQVRVVIHEQRPLDPERGDES